MRAGPGVQAGGGRWGSSCAGDITRLALPLRSRRHSTAAAAAVTVFGPEGGGTSKRKRSSPHFLFEDFDDSDEEEELPPHTTVDLTDRVSTGHVREASYRDV